MSASIASRDLQWVTATPLGAKHVVWWRWEPKIKTRCGRVFVPVPALAGASRCERCVQLVQS